MSETLLSENHYLVNDDVCFGSLSCLKIVVSKSGMKKLISPRILLLRIYKKEVNQFSIFFTAKLQPVSAFGRCMQMVILYCNNEFLPFFL